jgi:hypothetical protein
VRSGPDGSERDLEAALVALIEVALSGWERSGPPSEEQTRALARALAGAVREILRAPLREALQAGYELGLRAARETPNGQPPVPTSSTPGQTPFVPLQRAVVPESLRCEQQAVEPLPGPAVPPAVDANSSSSADAPPVPPAPREAPGVIVVEVSPFTSFTAVNRFHAAVTAAPGVSRAAIVSYQDGKLRLRVHHPDARGLATALQALELGPLRVLRLAPYNLELLLGSPPLAPPLATVPPG